MDLRSNQPPTNIITTTPRKADLTAIRAYLDVSQPYGPPRPVRGIALPFFLFLYTGGERPLTYYFITRHIIPDL
jgi:hypothetical protein